jgi:hypothetical protein
MLLKKRTYREKEALYKTAFSKIHGCYMKIEDAFKIKGEWHFSCSSESQGIFHIILRKNDLEKFCL